MRKASGSSEPELTFFTLSEVDRLGWIYTQLVQEEGRQLNSLPKITEVMRDFYNFYPDIWKIQKMKPKRIEKAAEEARLWLEWKGFKCLEIEKEDLTKWAESWTRTASQR